MDSLRIAINANIVEFKSLGKFFSEIFPTKEVHDEPGLKIIELLPQNLLELHGPGAFSTPFLFSESDIVIHFGIDNLDEGIRIAKRLGFTIIDELTQNEEFYFPFAYVRIRNGFVLGLYQNVKP
ncbi:hypothetical protein SNE26_24400 [Mucilaginibacter sp. cycad4]|uniref:hypothetical protein n=1 Tax=Mucilaginibacter sp. cycad4 TaxID=3342096 RepID=UPI002AAA79D8|nr:hypothetical protein [Mucilaginibacter gossypii]WPU99158.1 hypothetical protein SNE26_24400 [Mucilaginibacter gossypii]